MYLQRGAGGFLFPLELGRLCDETLLKDVLFQNVCIHNLQTHTCLLLLINAVTLILAVSTVCRQIDVDCC